MTLHNLQLAILGVLASDPWMTLKKIETLAEDRGDVYTALKTAVSKIGLCVVVNTPGINCDQPDGFIPVGISNVVITCFESPLFTRGKANRTTALNAAERVACLLTGRVELIGGHGEEFGVPSFVKIESGATGGNATEALIFYNVHFRVRAALSGGMAEYPPESTPKHPNL